MKLKGKIVSGEVWIDGKPLDPARSLALRNHSPTGFSWGYLGSGPSQLALAILLEHIDQADALALYMDFKFEVIGKLPQADIDIYFDLDKWLRRKWDEPTKKNPPSPE